MYPGSRPPKFGWVDLAVLGGAALLLVYVGWRVTGVLNYHWRWEIIPRFVLRYDAESGGWVANLLLLGLLTTLRLAFWGGAIGLLVGTAIGLARIAPSLLLRMLGATYVEAIRNIPPLVFTFVFYFFLSSQIMPLLGIDRALAAAPGWLLRIAGIGFGDPERIDAFLPAAFSMGLFEAAFIAEIVRAGLRSIGTGQWDAAHALGLNRRKALRHVVIPQALARIWPPLSGQIVLLIKNTSLAALVSIPDLTFEAGQVAVTTRHMFEVWLTAGAIYFVLCFAIAQAFSAAERRARRPGLI